MSLPIPLGRFPETARGINENYVYYAYLPHQYTFIFTRTRLEYAAQGMQRDRQTEGAVLLLNDSAFYIRVLLHLCKQKVYPYPFSYREDEG